MPIVRIDLRAGRTVEQKRKLVETVTKAVVDSVGAPAESVTVIIQDMAKEDHAIAGKLDCDM